VTLCADSICTGKDGVTGCGGVGQEGTDSEANEQDKTIEIPGEPIIATSTTDVECDVRRQLVVSVVAAAAVAARRCCLTCITTAAVLAGPLVSRPPPTT
jgi:hypothetical protein